MTIMMCRGWITCRKKSTLSVHLATDHTQQPNWTTAFFSYYNNFCRYWRPPPGVDAVIDEIPERLLWLRVTRLTLTGGTSSCIRKGCALVGRLAVDEDTDCQALEQISKYWSCKMHERWIFFRLRVTGSWSVSFQYSSTLEPTANPVTSARK
jgi:hypothetical protein